ncbi:MAG: hypothetical protein KDD62_11975 [Bdellovibrionales bacterium]|nr:hypothetical protein [Bdellovibrionales bacterium]
MQEKIMGPSSEPSLNLSNDLVISGLREVLSQHRDKRVLVLGTTCTGKSTMLKFIDGAVDQDKEVFPKLTQQESDFVCQTPWTEEIGRTMTRLVRERVATRPGSPIFGTVVIDCDHIVLLKIGDDLLRERVGKRGAKFQDAKNMQRQLEEEVRSSGISWSEYSVG